MIPSHRVKILGLLCTAALGSAAFAQETSFEGLHPGLREQALILDIIARVVEQNQREIWQSVNSRITIPGRPVGIKLVGDNIVVAAQFTPYLRRNGRNILVAQGQIWVDIPNEGVRYKTTIQTIPLEFGEQIYFFPLGSVNSPDDAHIEIQLELRPYLENESAGKAAGEPEDTENKAQGNNSSQ
ncbi:MAG: hypothetical protein LBI86_08540 [Treponema sp.]|jgi:hypothetical protein|nr:hypothetical protein [Treponema sp.]